jgi:RimJ/RimL family protein N-acetyltransferase
MINPYIIGEHIYLRHPTEEDARGRWYQWFSDEETMKYLGDRYWPNCVEDQLGFYRSLINDKSKLVLSIISKSDDSHIGVLGLSNINWVHRYADATMVVGEKSYRKMPYTFEAHDLLHKVAFLKLNLLNLKSSYAESSEASHGMQHAFKYKKVGVYENLLCIGGKREDVYVGILSRDDYLKSKGL